MKTTFHKTNIKEIFTDTVLYGDAEFYQRIIKRQTHANWSAREKRVTEIVIILHKRSENPPSEQRATLSHRYVDKSIPLNLTAPVAIQPQRTAGRLSRDK